MCGRKIQLTKGEYSVSVWSSVKVKNAITHQIYDDPSIHVLMPWLWIRHPHPPCKLHE